MIGCYYGNYFLIWGLFNKILFPNGNAYFVMDHSAYLDSKSGNSNVSMYLGERNHIYLYYKDWTPYYEPPVNATPVSKIDDVFTIKEF